MIYVYRRAISNSARELADALTVNARKLRDLAQAHYGQGVRAGDTVICWGDTLENPPAGVRVLNGGRMRNKLEDARVLREAGVPTVEVSPTRPPAGAAVDPAITAWQALMREVPHPLDRVALQRVVTSVGEALRLPIPVPSVWLPRRFNHVGGADLLTPPAAPDYFSKKEEIVEEYRIHSFKGLSIRAGKKVPREGVAQPHAWIRSLDGGWSIRYDEFHSKGSMRELAARAIEALGLDFGAVDIGKKADKTLVVLEVNRAPGAEGGTVTAYARAVERWLQETQ